MAAITYADFVKLHPEFAGAGGQGQTIITQAIADAESFYNASAFGTANLHVMAVRFKACSFLASGRYGQVITRNAKPADEYEERLAEVLRLVPARFIVA